MNIAEIIKQAREGLGMTQEDLAEKLEVSRQAVSKWELGASVPSPENLELLEGTLGVRFPTEKAVAPPPAPKAPFWSWKRIVLLILGGLMLTALFSIGAFLALQGELHTDTPRPAEPRITGVHFFDKDAAPFQPDLGDGWNRFAPGERVLAVVEFVDGTENSVYAVSLFLTPAGTETFDQREQLAVQAVYDGRSFALFVLDIPEGLMGHLDVVLECGGGSRVTQTLNVTAPPGEEVPEEPETLTLNTDHIVSVVGNTDHIILEVQGAPFAEVEWTTSDPSVARVANTGTVFIEGAGVAIVTASWNGQSADCEVYVYSEAVPGEVSGTTILR